MAWLASAEQPTQQAAKRHGHWRAQLRRRFGAGRRDNTSNKCGETRTSPAEAALDYARFMRDSDG